MSKPKAKAGKGWYHYSDMDGFHGIEFLPEGPGFTSSFGPHSRRQSAYGPFKTFGEARLDALEFFRTDASFARARIREVKAAKKADSFFRGND
jgi:hypothetical protein